MAKPHSGFLNTIWLACRWLLESSVTADFYASHKDRPIVFSLCLEDFNSFEFINTGVNNLQRKSNRKDWGFRGSNYP